MNKNHKELLISSKVKKSPRCYSEPQGKQLQINNTEIVNHLLEKTIKN